VTHPLHASDEVGRITGDLVPWALDFACAVMTASRKGERAARAEALAQAFELFPKIARRMTELERVAPASYVNGYEADAGIQDVMEVVRQNKEALR
jgi:hypothetical protein